MHYLTHLSAWIPMLVGVIFLVASARSGPWTLMTVMLPSVLMIAGSGRALLFSDLRATQLIAIGAILGLVLAIPIGFIEGLDVGITAGSLSALAFLSAGWFQIRLQPPISAVPAPAPGLFYSAFVAVDQAILGVMAVLTPASDSEALKKAAAESTAAFTLMTEAGWLANPSTFHRQPPPLDVPEASPIRIAGLDCEALSWTSGFEPRQGLPGADRFLAHDSNRMAHALVLRGDPAAPWLVCVHGFGMGDFRKDFRTFRVAKYHSLGLNVAQIMLPLHGRRAPGRVSGEHFFGLSVMDFVHAETQAIWDLRRLISWLRADGNQKVGVHGISLGAYTCALLATVDCNLDCVIAGVPPADMIDYRDYLASPLDRRLSAIKGVNSQRDRAVNSVVSPLASPSRVPKGARFIYAATGDQFVPVEQIDALWQHWEQPEISWCRGGHISALMQSAPRDFVRDAVQATLADPRG